MKIRTKLMAALLMATGGVVLCMFLVMQWSFKQGFRDYVHEQEKINYLELVELLAVEWRTQGNWHRLARSRSAWDDMLRSVFNDVRLSPAPPEFGRPPRPLENAMGNRPDGPPGPPPIPRAAPPASPPVNLPFLIDAQKRVIYGRQAQLAELMLYPVVVADQTVGYVGQVDKFELTDQLDLLFVKQQTQAFMLVAFVMVGISVLLSFPVASHLVKPIRRLMTGTKKLIAGDYGANIVVHSKDELGELSARFNHLAKTLAANESSRKRWIADISHELRTPLSVLKGEIEAVQDGIRSPNQDTFNSLHAEVSQLGRLVDDLYELSMSDIGALNYQKAIIDPISTLKAVTSTFESDFHHKDIEMIVVENKAHARILADDARLRQLFANLLKNTLRYTDAPGKLVIEVQMDSTHVRFHFKDSAPGVSASALAKLFDPLFREESSRNRALGGAGLGLAICRNIVDAHEGQINAQTSPLGGIWITVSLPLISPRGNR